MSQFQTLECLTRTTSTTPPTHSVIWLHGLGADCNDFAPIVPELNIPNTACVRFIFPNAPIRRVTINGNFPCRAWYDIYSLSDRTQEDRSGIQESQAAINQLIEQETNKGIPSNRIYLAGFSQGGAMALYTGLRYTRPLAGIIALSCYLPLKSSTDELHEANKHTMILQNHGSQDDVVPYSLGEETFNMLNQMKYNIELKTYTMGHEVCFQQIKSIGNWLAETSQAPGNT